MMRILLLSDTHSYIDDKILDYAKHADEVWHAGDIGDLKVTDAIAQHTKLRAVYGNIDSHDIRSCFPQHQHFNIDKLKVWITHIGGYPNRYNPNIKKELEQNPPDLFICGHSHILKVMPDKKLNLLHMNPGAIGKHGFHLKRTMLRFEINTSKIENLEVIDFGKRGVKTK
ncbi:MAG: YfcE family phosphodiesterase [Bacteroidetes bacterium]|nr:YfcE family phosphodiesterase [Bacteroidota bacterium]